VKTLRISACALVALALLVVGLMGLDRSANQKWAQALAKSEVIPSADKPYPAPLPMKATDKAAEEEAEAMALYRKVWQSARKNFLWQEKLSDWQKWEHHFDNKLKVRTDAEQAAKTLLDSLGDRFTRFNDAAVTKALNERADERDVVEARMLPGKIGYIRIRTFESRHTAVEVDDALRQLSGASAFVIDLRDNKGGYISQAFRVFAMLAEQGKFTAIKGISEQKPYSEELSVTKTSLVQSENGVTLSLDRPDYLAQNKPMMVLVNGKTASAAEMLAGALRDCGLAKLLGSLTFGKGVAQLVFDLPQGTSMQITFGHYFLPKGECVEGKGIEPDVKVSSAKTGDAQLESASKELLKGLAKGPVK
jgi:hypothetical protein